MGFLRSLKDKAIEKIAYPFLYNKMKPYGKLTLFNLDTEKNTIFLEIHLLGEERPHKLMIFDYLLTKKEGGLCQLKIGGADTDRAWLTQILKDHVVGKEFMFPMPDAAWKFVDMLL